MIDISSQQQLALLFPKSNKALEKILQSATPEQLKTLSEAKDIKAVLSQLMLDSLDASKSNKIILDILKNSEFFKDLGSFPKELKNLLTLLSDLPTDANKQTQSKLDNIIKLLSTSLLDFTKDDSSKLKNAIKDSGIFLESKLLQDDTKNTELKTSLQELKSTLQKSNLPLIEKVIQNIDKVLQNNQNFDKNLDAKPLETLKTDIQKIITDLKSNTKLADPIYSKEISQLITKLENATTKSQDIQLSNIKNIINNLSSELKVSSSSNIKNLISHLDKIETKINEALKENKTIPLLKDLLTNLESVKKDTSLNSDIKKLKQLSNLPLANIESLNKVDLNSFFTNFSDKLSPNTSKSIFDILEKILASLKQPSSVFEQKKIPIDIKSFLNNFEKELLKGDVVFSKHTQKLIDKVSLFSKPEHFIKSTLLQENIQKDIKALLIGLEKELSTSTSTTNQHEALKSVDKLLVHIDYLQLVSHLSNSSYLYLPYNWEQLQDGNFSMKKAKDGSFYCEIDLQLKEYGKLNMMLQLFEKNQLNMTIYTQKDDLKNIFKENMKELRSALVSVNITPRSIKLHNLNEINKSTKPYLQGEQLNELGFEVKG